MKKDLYIIGLSNISWGLFLVIPLYKRISIDGFSIDVALIFVPFIILYFFIGLAIILNQKIAWSLCFLIVVLKLLVSIISIPQFNFQTDVVSHRQFMIFVTVIWVLLSILSLASMTISLKRDLLTKMKINDIQYRWTLIISGFLGCLFIIFFNE